MGQFAALRILHIAQQCPCRCDRQTHVSATESLEVVCLELPLQILSRIGFIEMPIGQAAHCAGPGSV